MKCDHKPIFCQHEYDELCKQLAQARKGFMLEARVYELEAEIKNLKEKKNVQP